MPLLESLSSALKSVAAHKMRSILTMLGIIIGISSVIMITSIGDGVYGAIENELDNFNMSTIQVFPRDMFHSGPQLSAEDMGAIANVPNVAGVTGIIESNNNQQLTLRNPTETRRGMISGVDPNYSLVENITLRYGRFFTDSDLANNAHVAVIRPEISLAVFGLENSVGNTLYIEGNLGRFRLTVIGILDIDPDMTMAQTPANTSMILMPRTTLAQLRNWPGMVEAVIVGVDNPVFSATTAAQIARLLDIRHDRTDGFTALSMSTIMDQIDLIFIGVTGFITFVAGISLFVGGVGVMNIMMVTVTERTREIGIRKSLGATGYIIRLQFVFEAITITLVGGIIGVIFGLGSAAGLTAIVSAFSPMEIVATVDVTAVLIAVIVSISIGVIFGVYPAGKAAKLDPVDSLRYE